MENLPRHQAAVWGVYRFSIGSMRGFSAGAGYRWLSSFRDGTGPKVPAAGVVDALLAYDSQDWRYALNISNLADKMYMSTCLARGDCWWATRRPARSRRAAWGGWCSACSTSRPTAWPP